jgi:glycolate oxidase subunit GlcD
VPRRRLRDITDRSSTAASVVAPSVVDRSIGALLADLAAVLGPDRARAEPLELALYARDAGTERGHAAAVCFPRSTDEVASAVRIAARHDRSFVARGSGTGLAGGATPVDDPLVIVTTHMNGILAVDAVERLARVEPGVLNLDLSRAVAPLGLHYAPDPSSQQACSIGGNVATNAGGPHCLASGVTSAHVRALEVVLADGTVAQLGGVVPDTAGYDLRGVFVGSEGTMGITTAITVHLTRDPPDVRTLLLDFASIEAAAATVSGIIAAGILPAALEMMDAAITRAVEDFVGAGFPRDAAAVLLVELDGLPAGVAAEVAAVERIGLAEGARTVRIAADDAERALLWKGRKSAFGAIARLAPDYYLHDAVVPRTRLVDVLRRVYEIAEEQQLTMMNVFHAGDGNLHPLIVFDARDPGIWARVHDAGEAIIQACVDAGGVLSGEHGIGLEKRDYMPLIFSPDDLDAQAKVRDAFDPTGRANPEKVLPAGSRCGEVQRIPEGAWI